MVGVTGREVEGVEVREGVSNVEEVTLRRDGARVYAGV